MLLYNRSITESLCHECWPLFRPISNFPLSNGLAGMLARCWQSMHGLSAMNKGKRRRILAWRHFASPLIIRSNSVLYPFQGPVVLISHDREKPRKCLNACTKWRKSFSCNNLRLIARHVMGALCHHLPAQPFVFMGLCAENVIYSGIPADKWARKRVFLRG